MPCHAHSWRLESNVTPGGAIFRHFTRDTRSTPLALLSIRTRRARDLSSRTLSRSKKKEKERKSSLPFLSCTAWEIKFHFNPGNESERRKDLEGNEDGWGGDYRWVKIFFSSFSVFFILFIAAWKFICKVRCKVFTSGFYIVDKKQSMCAV